MPRSSFPEERQEHIMAELEHHGRVSVAELVAQFDVSKTTIRTDLDILAAQGLLVRTHGGAIAPERSELELSVDVRRRLHPVQKDRIGAAAAGLIEDGDAIVLDASTTALALAGHLKEKRELTVLTNGLLVALTLLESPGITVLTPGGFLRRDSASVVGEEGHEFVERFNFQKGFFSTKGLTLEEGLTDVNSDEVAIKHHLVARTRQVFAIVDSSKWGQVSFTSFATIDQVNCVITDEDAPADMVAALKKRGVDVIVA